MNVTVVHNTYNQTVVNNNVTVNRVSYNGGTGGIAARPSPAEEAAAREEHIAPTTEQAQHEHASGSNRALFASANHGQPPVAATAKPGVFSGREVVAGSLDDLRENFCRFQFAFDGDAPAAVFHSAAVVRVWRRGRVLTVLSREGAQLVVDEARALNPISVEVTPVTLKDIFLESVMVED